jgi:thioredoxin-dependent peroxiredoxin
MIHINKQAPSFSLYDQDGTLHTLEQYRGKKVLLFFYPKDNTPGCTTEACSFRDNHKALTEAGLVVLGISKDTIKSHKKFADKFNLHFPLLADEDTSVCQAYGVWGMKKFMGLEYVGITRSSFLIDEQGVVIKIYENVKPAKHVNEVASDLKAR